MATRADRRHDPGPIQASKNDLRSPFRHDRDRILYSPEFRRLSGITQVISPLGHYVTHNRLTHTLEVAHIAKAVAESLLQPERKNPELLEMAGGLDVDVVEAASLAHDIGHPPFGHISEEALNRKLRSKGFPGFEGNAQSFRVLTDLSVHDTIYPGLNLTRATLSAVSKYPWFEGDEGETSRKWGVYEEQREDFNFSRAHLSETWRRPSEEPTSGYRTLEAEIMDWADDVAYAIHDLEDFFKMGLIPLDKLKASKRERLQFLDFRIGNDRLAEEHQDALQETTETLLSRNSPFFDAYVGSHQGRAYLQRFSSGKIGAYITEPRLVEAQNTRGWQLEIGLPVRLEVSVLKGLLWYYVIESPSLISTRLGYDHMVSTLFDMLTAMREKELRCKGIYPWYLRERLEHDQSERNIFRCAADFISILTESQISDLYRRLTGMTVGEPLYNIIP